MVWHIQDTKIPLLFHQFGTFSEQLYLNIFTNFPHFGHDYTSTLSKIVMCIPRGIPFNTTKSVYIWHIYTSCQEARLYHHGLAHSGHQNTSTFSSIWYVLGTIIPQHFHQFGTFWALLYLYIIIDCDVYTSWYSVHIWHVDTSCQEAR